MKEDIENVLDAIESMPVQTETPVDADVQATVTEPEFESPPSMMKDVSINNPVPAAFCEETGKVSSTNELEKAYMTEVAEPVA